MDEMTAVQQEATTPTAEPEIDSIATKNEEPSAIPQAEEKPNEEANINTEQNIPEAEGFKLRYNHEDVDVTKEEAIRLAQIGKHYENISKEFKNEDIKSILSDLDYFAALQNKSVKDVVSDMLNGVENSYRQELTEELGEGNPLIEEMLELRKSKNMKAYEDTKSQRTIKEQQAAEEAEKNLTARLATQFEEVAKIFPEYTNIADVPDVVYKAALESGDLEKELLRFKLAEEKVIRETEKNEIKNKNENIGPVNTGGDAQSSLVSEMLKGIWG